MPAQQNKPPQTQQPSSAFRPVTPPSASSTAKPPVKKPLISFNILFIGGIFFAFLVIIISLLFLGNNWIKVSFPQFNTTNNTISGQNTEQITTPTISVPTPTRPIARIPGWEVYTGSVVNYRFQYPQHYRVEKGARGTLLLEKVSLYDSSYSNPLLNVFVWDYPGGTIQRQDIEKWCFRTLLEEAHQENLLCAFMSSAAIDELEIDNTVVFTVNSYNSFGEKVDYYIVPLYGKVIIIQSITLLNEQGLDNGKSQAKKVIPTFQFH